MKQDADCAAATTRLSSFRLPMTNARCSETSSINRSNDFLFGRWIQHTRYCQSKCINNEYSKEIKEIFALCGRNRSLHRTVSIRLGFMSGDTVEDAPPLPLGRFAIGDSLSHCTLHKICRVSRSIAKFGAHPPL